jgi:hypothetical protein
MASAAFADPREGIWEASFDTYYDALFEEYVADGLITRWSRMDDITKILVTTTASTSAIAGWALWNQEGFRTGWVILSGIAALLSIIVTSLGVSNRIKTHAENKRRFVGLRVDLETFRMKMRRDPDFDIPNFAKEFDDYRRRYSDSVQLLSNDTLRTNRFDKKMQQQVNTRLAGEIIQQQ